MTQKEKIMQHLRRHGQITVKEATYELGITQAATRIKELIEDEHQPIERKKWRTVVRKDGSETQVRVYEYRPRGQQSLFPKKHRNGIML
jgi:predicted ArsR family transcriptional regulator